MRANALAPYFLVMEVEIYDRLSSHILKDYQPAADLKEASELLSTLDIKAMYEMVFADEAVSAYGIAKAMEELGYKTNEGMWMVVGR